MDLFVDSAGENSHAVKHSIAFSPIKVVYKEKTKFGVVFTRTSRGEDNHLVTLRSKYVNSLEKYLISSPSY